MDIKRSRSQPSSKGPAQFFTGTVRIDPLFQARDPARTMGVGVTFEPGARTNWHTHPLGQDAVVTAGCGLVQSWGGPIRKIRPGDVVWCPPGEKHWHGATPTTAMTHLAILKHLGARTSTGWNGSPRRSTRRVRAPSRGERAGSRGRRPRRALSRSFDAGWPNVISGLPAVMGGRGEPLTRLGASRLVVALVFGPPSYGQMQ